MPGLIHDQSGSGATLFIEPAAVVELGNQYKKLIAEEQQEIERILSELTAMVAPYGGEINENIRILGEMDLAFAKAKLARDMNATEPKLNNTGYIRIVQGRHPLIPKETVRPIDIWLGRDFRTLIITGPNTGRQDRNAKDRGAVCSHDPERHVHTCGHWQRDIRIRQRIRGYRRRAVDRAVSFHLLLPHDEHSRHTEGR